MRIRVRHQTTYSYAAPARTVLQLLRMTPRSSEGHFVRRWRIEITPDARLDRGEDAYGNITHLASIDGPVASVRVAVEGEVDTVDSAGIVRGTVERLPLPIYLRQTPLTAVTPRLREFAETAAAGGAGETIAMLHQLMLAIHRRMSFAIGATTSATTADRAFQAGHGVCQDFAHIFIACARALDIPARYVSGYFLRTDVQDQDAGHAWAEAHVAGLGWIGFDPANKVCMTERHVRVAVGPDYLEAAPARGSQLGGADEAMAVNVHVAQGRGLIEG